MVDVLGHVAIGLLWAIPAWFVWDRRVSAAFVAFVLPTSLLPDVDLYIPGVPHHGVTHTVLFVVVVSVAGGAVVASLATGTLRRWWRRDEDRVPSWSALFAFVAGGLLVGGLSHLFGDMLSTASFERTIEPFWPLYAKPVSIYLIEHYSAPLWNGGLLLIALAIHAVLFVLAVTPIEHPYRM